MYGALSSKMNVYMKQSGSSSGSGRLPSSSALSTTTKKLAVGHALLLKAMVSGFLFLLKSNTIDMKSMSHVLTSFSSVLGDLPVLSLQDGSENFSPDLAKVCVCVCVCTCMCVYVLCVCVCMCMCVHVLCVCVCMCMCVHVLCVCICMCMCVHVLCVCICMCMCVHVLCVCVCMCMCVHVLCVCICMCMCVYVLCVCVCVE